MGGSKEISQNLDNGSIKPIKGQILEKKWLKSVSCDCAVRELAELNPWGIELLSSLCLETVELQFLLEYFRVEFLQLLCNHFLFCGNILSANFDDINQSN